MDIDNIGFEDAQAYSAHHVESFSRIPKQTAVKQEHSATPLSLSWMDMPMGPMLTICDETHLFMLEFITRKAMHRQFVKLQKTQGRAIKLGRTKVTDQVETELTEYFAGRLSHFQTPLMPTGTDFQNATWQQLCKIPHGQTRSYSQLAKMVGNPKAVRAVAGANARNGIALIIPCHRVIASGGGLGGYAGGLDRKAALIALEHAT